MTTEIVEKPRTESPPSHWPPIAHIVRKPWTRGERALCGAEVEGVDMEGAENVCEECVKAVRFLRGMGL